MRGGGGLYVTVEAAPAAVRNLFTSWPAAAASRDSPLFTAAALVPSPPAPASASVSGCSRQEEETAALLEPQQYNLFLYHKVFFISSDLIKNIILKET